VRTAVVGVKPVPVKVISTPAAYWSVDTTTA
jgi:hypothetical protein